MENKNIENLNEFNEGDVYTIYFKFDNSFSSVTGLFNGFVYLNQEGNPVTEKDVSDEEVMCNGPEGLWIDDEPIFFEEISYVEKV